MINSEPDLSEENERFSQSPHDSAILIVVSDGFGGFGDFLFALKLAQLLRHDYREKSMPLPPIYLITQPSGKDKIKMLGADSEYDTEVFTPDELKEMVEYGHLAVGCVIEGPVFQTDLLEHVDEALIATLGHVPLILIPEYGYSTPQDKAYLDMVSIYRRNRCKKLEFAKIIYTGFLHDEHGILLSNEFMSHALSEQIVAQLDKHIVHVLWGRETLSQYQNHTELSFQYSHDNVGVRSVQTVERFLKIHRVFYNDSTKNQDVIAVGGEVRLKKHALMEIKDSLMADGFEYISFYHMSEDTEEILYASGKAGKRYRMIYVARMSHPSMMACQILSGDLVGATGDQSFGEAFSAKKPYITYECHGHKEQFIEGYDIALTEASHHNKNIIETLHLLRTAKSDIEYERLGALLKMPEILLHFQEGHRILLERIDLLTSIVYTYEHAYEIIAADRTEVERRTHVREQIISLLKREQSREAEDIFRVEQAWIRLHDIVEGKPMWKHACETAMYHFLLTAPMSMLIEIPRIYLGDELQKHHRLVHLRRMDPTLEHFGTRYLSYIVVMHRLQQYYPKADSKRAPMFHSVEALFKDAASYQDDVMIGILLLNAKNIASEYHFFKPSKGKFFGSNLYSICALALKDLGVDVQTMTKERELHYFAALRNFIQQNNISDIYTIQSLGRYVDMQQQPKDIGDNYEERKTI